MCVLQKRYWSGREIFCLPIVFAADLLSLCEKGNPQNNSGFTPRPKKDKSRDQIFFSTLEKLLKSTRSDCGLCQNLLHIHAQMNIPFLIPRSASTAVRCFCGRNMVFR